MVFTKLDVTYALAEASVSRGVFRDVKEAIHVLFPTVRMAHGWAILDTEGSDYHGREDKFDAERVSAVLEEIGSAIDKTDSGSRVERRRAVRLGRIFADGRGGQEILNEVETSLLSSLLARR